MPPCARWSQQSKSPYRIGQLLVSGKPRLKRTQEMTNHCITSEIWLSFQEAYQNILFKSQVNSLSLSLFLSVSQQHPCFCVFACVCVWICYNMLHYIGSIQYTCNISGKYSVWQVAILQALDEELSAEDLRFREAVFRWWSLFAAGLGLLFCHYGELPFF